jgi:PadR family transcriptional regulator AphA
VATADSLLARHVVLALIVEKPRHGWAVHRELAPESEIGRAWTLSRQLTYRAIDNLEKEGLVRRASRRSGDGGDRVVLSPTSAGKKRARAWLEEPIEHVRDVRTELLVKLILRRRAGLGITDFVVEQRKRFTDVLDALTSNRSNDLVDVWRAESARSVMRFLEELSRPRV